MENPQRYSSNSEFNLSPIEPARLHDLAPDSVYTFNLANNRVSSARVHGFYMEVRNDY